MKIHLATTNAGKLREMVRLLGDRVSLEPPPPGFSLPAETGASYAENALQKARALAAATGVASLGDDSGLEVDALDGAPGIASARYAADDAARIARILRELRGVTPERRTARFRCVLALVLADGREILTEGTCEGTIAAEPSGSGGFGYDPLFRPGGETRTFGEMTEAEKDGVSHRGRAATALRARLPTSR